MIWLRRWAPLPTPPPTHLTIDTPSPNNGPCPPLTTIPTAPHRTTQRPWCPPFPPVPLRGPARPPPAPCNCVGTEGMGRGRGMNTGRVVGWWSRWRLPSRKVWTSYARACRRRPATWSAAPTTSACWAARWPPPPSACPRAFRTTRTPSPCSPRSWTSFKGWLPPARMPLPRPSTQKKPRKATPRWITTTALVGRPEMYPIVPLSLVVLPAMGHFVMPTCLTLWCLVMTCTTTLCPVAMRSSACPFWKTLHAARADPYAALHPHARPDVLPALHHHHRRHPPPQIMWPTSWSGQRGPGGTRSPPIGSPPLPHPTAGWRRGRHLCHLAGPQTVSRLCRMALGLQK